MHAILVTLGTDGDVFPYVGLGAALKSRGHRVTLVASAHYEPFAAAHGLGFQTLVSREENDALFGHPDFWNPRKTTRLQLRWGLRQLRAHYEVLSSLITDDSVLVGVPALLSLGVAHEKSGTPLVSVLLQPWMVFSAIAPPMLPGLLPLCSAPPVVWRMIWSAFNLAGDIFIGRHVNRIRASLGLRPAHGLFRNWLSRELVLGLFPEWYGNPQADWPSQLRMTGFPLYDGGPGGNLHPQLLEFCRAGDPPVAFTFGTGMAHPARLFREAVEALALAGKRGIFLTKYATALPNPLPASITQCAFAPFKKLFPLCAAVVHHGGIGTVAEALAAGVPQLVRPLCFDQFDNGERVRRLGVGDWLKPKKANPRAIADALTKLVTPGSWTRCRSISTRFSGVDGIEAAADLIERFAPDKLSSRITVTSRDNIGAAN